MQQNINQILERGEKLNILDERSQSLKLNSKKFEKMGKYINLQALYKTYGPIAAVATVIIFIMYIRFFR
jgi:vesicle transport protein SEC22